MNTYIINTKLFVEAEDPQDAADRANTMLRCVFRDQPRSGLIAFKSVDPSNITVEVAESEGA